MCRRDRRLRARSRHSLSLQHLEIGLPATHRVPPVSDHGPMRTVRPRAPKGQRPQVMGRSLDFCRSRTCRSAGHRPTPVLMTAPLSPQWQGPSPLPQRSAGIRTGRGAKAPGQRPPRPWRALLARRVGRWPLYLPELPVYRAMSRTGGGNAARVSASRPH